MSKITPNEKGEMKVPSYYWVENKVAHSFNRLKAKVFNLIEASVTDKIQQEALKGLIKGFANEEYHKCLVSMREEAVLADIIKPAEANDKTNLYSFIAPLEVMSASLEE